MDVSELLQSFNLILHDLPNEWEAKSDKGAISLATWFDKHLARLGVHTELDDNGNAFDEDCTIEFDGARIRLREKNYGCKIEVTVKDKKKIKSLFIFWSLWKILVDSKAVWGGPYRKDLTAKGNEENLKGETSKNDNRQDSIQAVVKHWEKFITEDDMKKVFLFLTTSVTQYELEKKLCMAKGRFAVDLAMLRKFHRFPEGVNGRNKFRKEWENYLQQASDEEREKYKEMTERFLPDDI